MISLRPYQDQLVSAARSQLLQGIRSVLMVSPTGSGKTVMAGHILSRVAAYKRQCWFVVHRRELITQSSRTFDDLGLDHGIISSGFTPKRSHVQICGVQSLARRIDKVVAPNLIIWDEAHHLPADSWSTVFSRFPDAIHLGLSATPTRLDGKGLREWFSAMVEGPTTRSLIEQGVLSPYRLFAPSVPDLSKAHTRGGDYANDELSDLMDKPSVTGDAIKHYKKLCYGKRAIVFSCSVKHSQHIVTAFIQSGIPAAHLDGSTDRSVRDRTLSDFRSGKIQVLSNVDLFGEGFDVPAIEVAILLRPTQSTSLYLQQVGRSLRIFPGKEQAIILDHAGNCFRHGLPDDLRNWSLDSESVPKSERIKPDLSIRQCKNCFAAFKNTARQCPFCGFLFETKERTIAVKEGDLSEITAIQREKKKEQGSAKTLEQLMNLAIARKYKNPRAWAYHVMSARSRKSF